MRKNISFDQILNQVRKDERDYILYLLEQMEEAHRMHCNESEASILRTAIDQIKAHASGGIQVPNNRDGTPNLLSEYNDEDCSN